MVSRGDIVQLDPETSTNQAFGACVAIVDKVKPWGVVCYIPMPTAGNGAGDVYYRAENGTFHPTGGKAIWVNEAT
jgi:hypothetical protein